MTMSSQHLYVYYRIRSADATLALRAVQQVLHAARPYCRHARLMQRADTHDPQTWMEVYEQLSDSSALSAQINAAVVTSGLAVWLLGERHAEFFIEP